MIEYFEDLEIRTLYNFKLISKKEIREELIQRGYSSKEVDEYLKNL